MKAQADGRLDGAIDLSSRSVELEDSIPLMFGPPFVYLPARELLAALLLEADRPDEAYDTYREALARTPGRTSVLEGLAQAGKQLDIGS